jgi:hypothetical protein
MSPPIFVDFKNKIGYGGGSGDGGGLESYNGDHKFISCILHANKCPL